MTAVPTLTGGYSPSKESSRRLGGPAGTSSGCAASARSEASYDFAESITNAVIGLLVSWAATRFVLGYSPSESAAITAMFFGLSFGRAWVLRRVFRRLA